MKFIVIKPHITELSMKEAGKGVFTFLVDAKSDKNQIKNEIQRMYKVTVKKTSTSTIKRAKTISTKFGRKQSLTIIKKARVLLEKGQGIPAFEVTEEGKKKNKKEKSKEVKV